MIIKQTEKGYLCQDNNGAYYEIPSKEFYEQELANLSSVTEPSNEELVALGRQYHPYYNIQSDIDNINNTLQSITDFENGNNIQ